MHKFRQKYIGDKAFYKRYLMLAIPMIIQNAITNLVSFLDNIMVGQLGTEQMSGVAIFGMFYALSGFTAAFSWNLMWFDCVLLLPLVLLGLERLVNEDKGILYTVTLGLTILSNYYIAIMVCISLVFYFLVLFITMPVPEKKSVYLQKIGYFTLFSLLAGALSAASYPGEYNHPLRFSVPSRQADSHRTRAQRKHLFYVTAPC